MMAPFFDIIKEKLRSHKPEATPQSWAKMEALIEAEPALSPQPSLLVSLKKWSAAAVLLLLLGGTTWYFYPDGNSVNMGSNEVKNVENTRTSTPQVTGNKLPSTPPNQFSAYGPHKQEPFGKSITNPELSKSSKAQSIASNPDSHPSATSLRAKSLKSDKAPALITDQAAIYRKVKKTTVKIANTPSQRANTFPKTSPNKYLKVNMEQQTLQLPPKILNYSGTLSMATIPKRDPLPLASAMDEKFRANRGKWSPRLNLVSGLYTGKQENSFGIGAELELQNDGWRASAGLINHSVSASQKSKINQPHYHIKSTEYEIINAQINQHIDSTWVILGFNKGVYEYDTTYHTTFDTTHNTVTDTTTHNNWLTNTSTTTMSYTEIPLHVSYAWQWQRWEVTAGAGLTTGFLTQKIGAENKGNRIENHTVGDASLRLGLRYHITPRWSILVRPNYRLNIWQSRPVRTAQTRLGLQWGVSLAL